jgi:AraC family transcriptional regulator
MKNLLTIDAKKDNYVKKVFNLLPSTSANQVVKSEILKINLLDLPSGSTAKNKSNHHSVLIGYNQLDIEIEVGGLSQVGEFKPNHSIIVPANCVNYCSWAGVANCLFFDFEPELLERTYYESTNSYLSRLLPCLPRMDSMIYEITSKMKFHIQYNNVFSENYVDSLGSMLISHLAEMYCNDRSNQISIHPFTIKELKILNNYILTENNSELKVQNLAQLFDLSLPYFGKRIKVTTGLSPHQYLNKVRIEEAKKYLSGTNKKISEVSRLCNFASSETLRRLLKIYD